MRLLGIDLAWQSEKNHSAGALGECANGQLRVTEILSGLDSIQRILAKIDATPDLQGIAIDAPLVIPNETGQRDCERGIGREYGSRKASCHTSNRRLYPEATSVALSQALAQRGFAHLGRRSKWQLECYPHPALIEVFGLAERHLYKKGPVADRREGQVALGRMIRRLEASEVLSLHLADELCVPTDPQHIAGLKGAALKRNEDMLDAIVCLYVAGLYAAGYRERVFGDADSGYIYVPAVRCTHDDASVHSDFPT